MNNFDDSEYENLIGDLLHDTQYIEISNGGKLAGLRKHAEVMVRKILDIGSSKRIMLGYIKRDTKDHTIGRKLSNLGEDLSSTLIEIIGRINPLGSEGSHTQHTSMFLDEDVRKVEDALLDLYAFLFIHFFSNHKVNLYTPATTLNEFSFLPPIIRYKTWDYLFKKDSTNIRIADKLCLSIIKTFDKERAYKWLDDNSEALKSMPYPTHDEVMKYLLANSVEVNPGEFRCNVSLNFEGYSNMYDLLYDKIKDPRTSINESGRMYKNFEEAIRYFKAITDVDSENESEEIATFHSLMKFVYIGRKAKE